MARIRISKATAFCTVLLTLTASSCSLTFDYPESQSESSAALCTDATDNDYDGLTDCDDPSCDGHCPETDALRCEDGRDNDGDGLVDGADPRCWDVAARHIRRCASTDAESFDERFDGALSAGRWVAFGATSSMVESQVRAGDESRTDRVFGSRSVPVARVGGVMSRRVFSADSKSFVLAFSTRLESPGYLRVALVPAALAPEEVGPIEGSEEASVGLVLDARGDPSISLVSRTAVTTIPWDASSWHDVELAVADGQFVVRVDDQQALSAKAVPIVPSRLVLESEARFWEDGSAAAQLDDLRLTFFGEQPCGVASPQIPFGAACRQDPEKLEWDVGFTVAVASAGSRHCALLTAAPEGHAQPTEVQAWSSADGDAWSLEATLPTGWEGALRGAGVAWDDNQQRYRAVVGVEKSNATALLVGHSVDCSSWSEFEEVAQLDAIAEAPSYLLPGVASPHEIYVTFPTHGEGGRALWRLRSNDGRSFALEQEPVAVFESEHVVAAPISLSRYGPKDVVAVYPLAPHAEERGLGVLIADEDDLSVWKTAKPWPLLSTGEELGGFDSEAIVSGAMFFGSDHARLLYAGRGQPLPQVGAMGDSALSAGSAWVFSSETARADASIPPAPECGNGSCEPSESCETCPIDCDPCDGEAVFSEPFDNLDAWETVVPTTKQVAKPFYVRGKERQLGLDPQQPAWLKHPTGDLAGDFELSFDVHVVPPSEDATERCSAFVGLGMSPEPHAMNPRGVFLRVDQSRRCSGGAPVLSARVRTGEAKVTSLLSSDDNDCSGATIGAADAWHHVAIRREDGLVSLRVWAPDGCELGNEGTEVGYLGALAELDSILIGWSSTFGDDGWQTSCAAGSGVVSLDNVVLRRLPCAEGSASCDDGEGHVACVDLTKSPEHCGQCFNRVGPAEVCEAGKGVCQGTLCQDADTGEEVCADLLESEEHCGACGVELTGHEVCRGGLRQASMRLMPGGYFIDTTEVTRAQYAAWLATEPPIPDEFLSCPFKVSFLPACGWPPGELGNFPVRCVDWCDADGYCRAAGKRLCGRIGGGELQDSELNKEEFDQWYAACSSAGAYDWPYGNEYDAGACLATPVGEVASMPGCQSPQEAYSGVFDLAGSAVEWTSESLYSDPQVRRIRAIPPTESEAPSCGSTSAYAGWATSSWVGFRCCAL